MIDPALLKQLNHPDVDQRKRAINALAKTRDPEAINYLATVYQQDKNAEVRELARKAGIYIRQHNGAMVGGSGGKPRAVAYEEMDDDEDSAVSTGTYYEEHVDEELPGEVKVSPIDEERAAGLVKQALDIQMRGDNDRALKYLRDALKRNPNLARDGYTTGLAATILGMPADQAIREVMNESDGRDKPKRGEKGKRGRTEEPGIGDAIVDLLIYLLVNAGIIALAMFVYIGLFSVLMNEVIAAASSPEFAMTGGTAALIPNLSTTLTALTQIGIVFTLVYSGIAGVISTIVLLIQYVFIHIVSVTILNGDGTMVRLITKATIPMAFAYPVYYIAIIVLILIPVADPEFTGMSVVLQFAAFLGVMILIGNRIGAAYRFGTVRGCASIILGSIALSLVFCVCSFLASSALTANLSRP